MARIAVGGFQHETNTFAPHKSGWPSFQRVDCYPSYEEGSAMLEAARIEPWPIRGALEVLTDHELVPLAWAGTTPSAEVTDEAFERIAAAICARLAAAGPVDGLYLDLHGAAVIESFEDGEGELLRRVRAITGPDTPIAISLDLHTNLTQLMVDCCDVIDIYRTYPHIDMPATGARTATHLLELIDRPRRRAKALRRPDFLVPINWGCTLIEPAGGLYERMADQAAGTTLTPALAMGFPQADIKECGPAVVVTGDDTIAVNSLADRLLADLAAQEDNFAGKLFAPEDAAAYANDRAGDSGPIVIADTQDNPGGGGPGDTVGLLEALVRQPATGAVFGILIDAESAAQAHELGVDGSGRFRLGGKSGMPGHRPFEIEGRVLRLGDGRMTGTGPMAGGGRFAMGPTALIDLGDVRCAVASVPSQTLDQAQLRHFGIEPAEERILAIKSSVHFRADFQPIAAEVIVAVAPGPVTADLAKLDYRRLRTGVRVMPAV